MDWNLAGFIITSLSTVVMIIIAIKERKKANELDEKLEKEQFDIIKKYGFVPLKNKDNESENGLELFENKIVELIKQAKKNVKLCLVTPLLHSLRNEWIEYNGANLDEYKGSHWAENFCEELYNTVKDLKDHHDIELDIKIIHVEDNLLRKFISYIPDKKIGWKSYEKSIHYFYSKIKGEIGDEPHKPLSRLDYYQVPEAPIYFALIDTPDRPDSDEWSNEPYSNGAGVMTFINCQDLLNQRINENKTADEISKDLDGFEFNRPLILKFFLRLFNTLTFQNFPHLYNFYKIMNSYGYDWGMVHSTDFNHIIKEINKIYNSQNDEKDEELMKEKALKIEELLRFWEGVEQTLTGNKYFVSIKDKNNGN